MVRKDTRRGRDIIGVPSDLVDTRAGWTHQSSDTAPTPPAATAGKSGTASVPPSPAAPAAAAPGTVARKAAVLPPAVAGSAATGAPLSGWRDLEQLKLLNLLYDITPSEFITAVACDAGIVPASSVPAVLRECVALAQPLALPPGAGGGVVGAWYAAHPLPGAPRSPLRAGVQERRTRRAGCVLKAMDRMHGPPENKKALGVGPSDSKGGSLSISHQTKNMIAQSERIAQV